MGALNFRLVMRGKRESEDGAARVGRFCPQASPMGIDNGATYGQAYPDSAGFCSVERIRPGVPHDERCSNATFRQKG